jgi:HPt (histidine-containing phosphotransfer) domain-containing protein
VKRRLGGTTTVDPSVLEALEAALGAGSAAEIVAAFLADSPARMERMRTLAARGAANPLGREAHALAGSAATLGLTALAAGARALEAAMEAAPPDLPPLLSPLEEAAAVALAWLQQRIPLPAPPAAHLPGNARRACSFACPSDTG